MSGTPVHSEIRSVDREVLEVLRREPQCTVTELEGALGVTTTAVRQRLSRLEDDGLIERIKQPSLGRGRPTFRYRLSVSGHRIAGADYAELADAMWQEILAMPDTRLRYSLLRQIAVRLGRQYAQGIRGTSLAGRLQSLSHLMEHRRIPAAVGAQEGLPVLDIHACPYPELADGNENREMCKLEEEMISQAMGQPMHLSRCRLDGDNCCQFSPESQR